MEETSVKSESSCETSGVLLQHTFKWTIHNFTLHMQKLQQGEKIVSSDFFIEGSVGQWVVELICFKIIPPDNYIVIFLHDVLEKSLYPMECNFYLLRADGTQMPVDARIPIHTKHSKIVRLPASKVTDSKPSLLPSDSLTIVCDITLLKDTKNVKSQSAQFHKPDSTLVHNMESMFDNRKFGDVELVAGGRQFQAHKFILAARSPVFSTMFDQEMKENKENKVEIEDIDAEVLEEVLRYIYTDKVPKLSSMAIDLLAAADKYDLEGLRVISEESLFQTLHLENAGKIWITADRFRAGQLNSRPTLHQLSKGLLEYRGLQEAGGIPSALNCRSFSNG